MTESRPVILSQGHVTNALADNRFFEVMPEFRPLQVKRDAMKADLATRRGCRGCKQARVQRSLFSDFTSIVSVLSPDGLRRLKSYLHVDKLMMNRLDPTTRQIRLVTM